MRKGFKSSLYLYQVAAIVGFNIPEGSAQTVVSGISDTPDEAEDGDITVATDLGEVGDVYFSEARACFTLPELASYLPKNKGIAAIVVADPVAMARKVMEDIS